MHYLIYKITNRLNNKIYVGKHKTEDKNDDYFGSGILIERAIAKHGKENFVKEILFELPTEEEMNRKEADIVDEDFVARDDTYNIMTGGQGGWSYVSKNRRLFITDKWREACAQNWEIGRDKLSKKMADPSFNELFRRNVSRSLKLYYTSHEQRGSFQGHTHTNETRKKMRQAKLGKYDGDKNPMFGKMWINNGSVSTRIDKNSPIPDGYKKGRLPKSLA